MKLTANTPTKWAQFRAIMVLPGSTRVKDVPLVMDNTALAMFFFSGARTRGESVETEQERAEFGCPTTRQQMEM